MATASQVNELIYRNQVAQEVAATQYMARADFAAYMRARIERDVMLTRINDQLTRMADMVNVFAGDQFLADRDLVDQALVRAGKPPLPPALDLAPEEPGDGVYRRFSTLGYEDLENIFTALGEMERSPKVTGSQLGTGATQLDGIIKRKATEAGAWAVQKFVAQENAANKTRQKRYSIRKVRYARITRGNCGFCLMLASRGAVYSDERSAGAAGHAFHKGCGCVVKAVWEGQEVPPEVTRAEAAYDEFTKLPKPVGKDGRPLTASQIATRFETFVTNMPK